MEDLPAFKKLWDGFPRGSVEDVKTLIGGRVDADWIKNTCAIRVSRALNQAGAPVPFTPPKNTISGADGKWHFFKVADLRTYLLKTYGPPGVVVKRSDKAVPIDASKFAGMKGIIHFDVQGWTDATGHFTVWDGTTCGDKCYFDKASAVSLWKAP
jgi:hypothetical protein